MRVGVLLVCLGNICRSPTAHGVLMHKIAAQGLQGRIDVDSAGTGDWHVGEAPDRRAAAAAAQRGYDLSALRARQVEPADFRRFELILAMDDNNLRALQELCPREYAGELGLFLRYGSGGKILEVPDPYYGGEQGFEQVLDLIEDAADGLLKHLRQARY